MSTVNATFRGGSGAVAVLEDPEIVDVKTREGDAVSLKRLNLNLAEKAFNDVQALAKRTNRSMTELVRLGLGLVKIALEARDRGERLAVVDNAGKPLREILIP